MPRELETVQAARAGSSHIAPVTLVKLTTYSDKHGPTIFIDKQIYLSNLPCTYKYGGGSTQVFLPIVTGGGDFISSMSHLPQPENLESFGQELDLTLSNLPINGKRGIELLRDHNMEGATVEIAQLLLDEIGPLPLDLTSFVGTEHTVLFRGLLVQIAPITDFSLTLKFRADLPSLANDWIFATDDTKVHPEDVGKRIPRIYGKAVRFPVIAWEVGFTGTISDALTSSENNTNKEVDDTTGLPNSPTEFDLLVDREKITCTKVDATTIKIKSGGRGAKGTTAVAHDYGSSFQEQIAAPVWIVSDQESDSLPKVYSISDVTGKLVRLDDQLFSGLNIVVADTTTISGRTVTSIQIESVEKFIQHPHGFNSGTGATTHSTFDQRHLRAVDNYMEVTGTSNASYEFEDTLGYPAMGTVTLRLWMTKGTASPPTNIELRINNSAGTIFHTITGSTLAAKDAVPSLHEFTFVIDDVFDDAFDHDVYITHSDSGDVRHFDCELEVGGQMIGASVIDQEADSITGNAGSQANMDLVIDGNDGTFMLMTTAAEHIDIDFPSIGGHNFSTINILMKPVGSKNWDLRETDGGTDLFDRATEARDEDPAVWLRFAINNPDEIVGNEFTLNFNQASDWGDIHRVTLSMWLPVAVPDVPQTQLFADCDGVVAPGSGYQVSAGVVLEHPADIIKHWIEVVGGETLDSASYTAYVTALGASAKWAVDVRSLGFTWAEILQRMAFEGRCNIIPVEKISGREWKILSADDDYGFGSTTVTITQTHNLTDQGRTLDDIASFFNFRYAFDAGLPGAGSEEGFKLALLATPDITDVPITTTLITDAAERFGDIDADPIAFRAIQDANTAKDVAGYIVQERMANNRRVFNLRDVAWFDALPLDVGDIVSIQAPWATSATTCRVVLMSKGFSSHVWEITAIEVLENGTRT